MQAPPGIYGVLVIAPQGQGLEKRPVTICSTHCQGLRGWEFPNDISVIKVLQEKHGGGCGGGGGMGGDWAIIAILIPIRIGSESPPSQWLHLGIGPRWPGSQE